ncbi:DUF2235 domain-containing protein [Paracoccus sp. 1_MG-2023]|uniref:DUF2235 domain-containing protein n=1 Tax=unclassified Paracoccus (in: a-proteobacteria) TaxID=2688777 RepID=UPI001C08641E|nr:MULTISPECIES: DUF2235 domain-containing protein [unclassified Paracoccus (in: a-proteobacteria)]MBU2957492.1 DUF2235 domain-containing protein [Paracoccus sp. C2R09]MDO6670166.1 DUF2235 domain-containing protein [Paracoccus sp. 1_MG-2023]
MKRIAVFCDGTWSSADQEHRTNVAQLALCVPPSGADGVAQVALYYEGVGVPQGGNMLQRLDEKLSGGAMGFGLNNRIAQAFQGLARHYEPGDQVFLFGFSRGAYTARSLAGLIRNCGLPKGASDDLIRDCFWRYRSRGTDEEPDSDESLAFRLHHCPEITTSRAEDLFRRAIGRPAPRFRVTYLGIWDTVGALGIPSHWGIPANLLNRKHQFHDTQLSGMVSSARHAVALDERRRNFLPTLWDNLPILRHENPEGEYLQQWFAGVHGAVGGGGDVTALSCIALSWIADGAARAGLGLDRAMLRQLMADADPLGPISNSTRGPGWGRRILDLSSIDRSGPSAIADLAHPAIARFHARSLPAAWQGRPYRPKSLDRIGQQIGRVDLAQLRDYAQAFA